MVTGTELFAGIMREVEEALKSYVAHSREREIIQKLLVIGYTNDSLQPLQMENLGQKLRLVCEDLAAKKGLRALKVDGVNIDALVQHVTEELQPEYTISAQFSIEHNPLYPILMTGASIGDLILSDEYQFRLDARQEPVTLQIFFDGQKQSAQYSVSVNPQGTIRVGRDAVIEPRGSKLLDAIVKDLMQYESPPVQA